MNISFENAQYIDVGFSQGSAFDVGFVTGDEREDVLFGNREQFDVTFSDNQSFDVDFGNTATITPYTGTYDVIPKVKGQVLETKEKYMNDDVTVYGVPYFETSNESGTTVYIAGEL